MKRRITGFSAALVMATCALASAQTASNDAQPPTLSPPPAPSQPATTGRFGRLEITGIPAGALFVRQGDTVNQPSFNTYAPGAAVSVKLTSHFEVEGEALVGIGQRQELKFEGQQLGRFKPPNMLGYSGNLLVNLVPSHRMIVPYVVGGIGGLHLYSRDDVGVSSSNSLVGDVGAGAKVMWGPIGVRGDYRFFALRGTHTDQSFIGPDARYGNRVYAGLVFAPGREKS